MNTNEVVETFRQLGWTPKLNVDRYAEKDIGDRVVHVLFKLKNLGEYQKFDASHSVKSASFSAAVKEVEGGRSDYNDLLKVNFKDKVRFQEPKITPKHIEIACDAAFEWAKSVDINKRYEELCDIDPSTPGAAGVWHLAALGLMRRIDKLTSYQVRFEAGDNCGFVPFITKDYIDRAVALAEEVTSDYN
jgi:hypothetical protein